MRRLLMTATVAVLGASAAAQAQVAFREDFTSAELQSGWQVVNENAANYSLSARSGFLRILTQRGALEEDNHINNLVVRQFTGNFVLETKVEFDPRAAQQFAGLLIYESQTNAAALGLTFVAGERGEFRGLALVSAELASGNTQPPVQRYDESNASDPNVVYLRLLRSGDQLVAGFSQDGATFTDFGSIINAFPETVLVGVGATNGDFETCGAPCDTAIPADFDYFQITAVDDDPGNGGVELEELAIDGPETVTAGESANYTATAHFSDDTQEDVTAVAQWIIAPPGNGTIAAGALAAGLVPTARYVTVVATYSHGATGAQETLPAAFLVQIVPAGGNGAPMCGLGVLSVIPLIVLRLGAMRLRRLLGPKKVL